MSTTLTIQGKVIQFPTSADSPNWSQAVVDFAKAVASALSGLAGTYDVAPQIYTITADVNTNVNIPLLSFPTSNVLGAVVPYSYSRDSDTNHEVETGVLLLIYNANAGIWDVSREGTGTDANTVSFNVTNAGQVQFSTTAIGGTFSTGTLAYSASAIVKL